MDSLTRILSTDFGENAHSDGMGVPVPTRPGHNPVSREAGSIPPSPSETKMAAFSKRTWGRYLTVKSYIVFVNGKKRKTRAHLRKWPGTKNRLYFKY